MNAYAARTVRCLPPDAARLPSFIYRVYKDVQRS
jgi:hypothetical protein